MRVIFSRVHIDLGANTIVGTVKMLVYDVMVSLVGQKTSDSVISSRYSI